MLICNLTKQLDFNLYLRVIHNSSLCSFRRRVFLQPVGKVSLLATGVGGREGVGGAMRIGIQEHLTTKSWYVDCMWGQGGEVSQRWCREEKGCCYPSPLISSLNKRDGQTYKETNACQDAHV